VYNEIVGRSSYFLYSNEEGNVSRKYEDIKNAVGYERLSDEDREKRGFSLESESISSQKLLIEQFCDNHNISMTDNFYDDGITGQTFERDGWNQLVNDIKNGKIDCVITKDLSRLGRDHTETGYYIEKFFPENNIRYISINDNWDSKYDPVDLILWKLAYNDVYCADISKKVKSILDSKKRQGLYVASFAPYGYKKNEDDKHYLVIDPDTAPVVKEAFELAHSGLGTHKIAVIFNEKKYITPGIYSGRGRYTATRAKVGHYWTSGMVRRILTNEVYTGDLAQGKRRKVSYKSKKVIRNEHDEWIIVKGTHEPLVSREIFDSIQEMMEYTSKKYTRLPGEQHLLGKLLICKDCNHRISISWRNPKHHERGRIGVCNFYKKYSKHNVCTPHHIAYEDVEEQVISYVKEISRRYLEFLNTPALIKTYYKKIDVKIKEQELRKNKLLSEKDKAENLLLKLYEDKLSGEVTESMYKTLSEKKTAALEIYNTQLKDIEKEIKKLSIQLVANENKMNNISKLLSDFINSEVLTQDMLSQIIEKIYVGEEDSIDVVFRLKEFESILQN